MNVVDSSAWLEYFADGPNAEHFSASIEMTSDQGRSVDEIEQAFRESVDDYLDFCEKRSEAPDKPFTGKLMLWLSPRLHREVYVHARREGKSLNEWISEKLERAI